MVLDGAPVAAVDACRAPMKLMAPAIQRPARLAITSRMRSRICLADDGEEFAREIGPAPFARAGVHVEGEERVPDRLGQVGAGEPSAPRCRAPAPPCARGGWSCACARRARRGSRRSWRSRHSPNGIAGRCAAGSRARRAARHSGSVRKVTCAEDSSLAVVISTRASARAAAHGLRQRAGAGEQARAGHRRERHRHLQLGVIVAAGALEGLGPAVVEDIFAARMALHVAGRGAEQRAVGRLRPAGGAAASRCGRRPKTRLQAMTENHVK